MVLIRRPFSPNPFLPLHNFQRRFDFLGTQMHCFTEKHIRFGRSFTSQGANSLLLMDSEHRLSPARTDTPFNVPVPNGNRVEICLKLSHIIIQAHTAFSGGVGLLFAFKRNSGHRHRRQQPLFERDHIIGRTANDLAQLLQGKHSDVSIFLERIQRVIINAALQKLILRHIISLHGLPQWSVIDYRHHHISCRIIKLYVVF